MGLFKKVFGSGTNLFDPLDIWGGTARDYNSAEAAKQRYWQSNEAAIDRQWQTEMANTAHQREVKDLQAAGLNPILSANSGAAAGSGGMATGGAAASTQQNSNLGSLISIIQGISSLKNAGASAKQAENQKQQVENQNELFKEQIENLKNEIQNRNINTAAGVRETEARIGKINEETRELQWTNAKNELLGISSKEAGYTRAVANAIRFMPTWGKSVKETWSLLTDKLNNADYNQKSKILQELWETDRKAYWRAHDMLHPERYKKGA